METTDVLVVGAGLAGLAFARDARANGWSVRLLDKGRGVGGRASARRWDAGIRVDHGAQYFTARGERLGGLVDEWLAEGWLRVWARGFPVWENGAVTERPHGHPRYAPVEGMSRLPRRLADGLDAVTGATVTDLHRDAAGWTAICADGRTFAAARLVLNLPPAQLIPLVRPFTDTAPLAAVALDPTWTLLLRLERDIDGADWPAIEVRHSVIAWIARDHTKRAGNAAPALVVHAAGDWSRAHLEEERDEVEERMRAALTEIVGPVAVRAAQVHRWRYAQVTQPLGRSHHWDPDPRLGWCGDWCVGPRIEGALESGWELARALGPKAA